MPRQIRTVGFEFYPDPSVHPFFIVQAELISQRAWLSVSLPNDDLGAIQNYARTFAQKHNVRTRIRLANDYPTLTMTEHLAMIRKNISIYERSI